MNLNWITSPATIYGVLLASNLAFLYLTIVSRAELRSLDKRRMKEREAAREVVEALARKMDELSEQVRDRVAVPPEFPSGTLNIHKRAEALRMYRRGSDSQSVADTLALSAAEADLLRKVHRVLAGEQMSLD